MGRLLGLWRNATLRAKLTFVTLALAAAALCISQPLLYAYVAHRTVSQARNEAYAISVQAQKYLDDKMKNVVERLFYIRLDPAFENELSQYLLETSGQSYGVAMTALVPTLSVHKVTEPLINSMYLYTPQGTFTDGGLTLVRGYDFTASALYARALETPGVVCWHPVQEDEIFITHRQVLPVTYRFKIDGYGSWCILLANLDVQALTDYLKKIVPDGGAQLLVLDDEGALVTRPQSGLVDEELLAQASGPEGEVCEVELAGKKVLQMRMGLSSVPWSLIYLQPEDAILGSLRMVGGMFLLVTVVALLLMSLGVSRAARSVTQPLSRLTEYLKTVDPSGEFEDFPYPYQNEVGSLSASSNQMLRRIHTLMEEQQQTIRQLQEEKEKVRIEQQLKRRAELKALQAQINPHFLYNTLDSIRWKAEHIGADDISQMTKSLATLFRVGLSRGREVIPLEEETRHVESYLQIQKLRYGDRLSYTLQIPAELRELYTVKLILQPLVENAIYHGIKEKETPGTICVTGRREKDTLLLSVEDDGPGIPKARLEILQADLARGLSVSGEGYGIFNVNERVRLYFGPQYGLALESRFGSGCRATVTLPCIHEEEVGPDGSLIDRG